MDTFATLGFALGTMGFIFGLIAYTQISALLERVLALEKQLENNDDGDDNRI